MRRLGGAALLGVAALFTPSCVGKPKVLLPNGAECGEETAEDITDCAGGVCLVLVSNAQGMAGMCSQECYLDSECSPHEGCESAIEGAGNFCLRLCNSDADCYDEFVCRLLNVGNPRGFCLIDPLQ